jgi:hypothetical protein
MLNCNLENLPNGEEIIKLSQINNWLARKSKASLYMWKSIDGK